jgi:predicted CoA-substrate-specific enzyme activase
MYIGIDIGSISAKIAVTDRQGSLQYSDYRYHRGDPAGCLEALFARAREHGQGFFASLCTTGSGRTYAGALAGADMIRNEITATWRAAWHLMPGARTVMEIGGQDSKLIVLENGEIRDFRLNSVCAAGTGSFIEQQSSRLGLSPVELSAHALRAVRPARFTGRCTVFVETEMINLQQRGFGVEAIAAGLFDAVAENYLNDLSPGMKIEPPVLFCGGVSQIEAVTNAFSRRLGMEITVPPANTIMAALGAALLAFDEHPPGTGAAMREIQSSIAGPVLPAPDSCSGTDCLECGACLIKKPSR